MRANNTSASQKIAKSDYIHLATDQVDPVELQCRLNPKHRAKPNVRPVASVAPSDSQPQAGTSGSAKSLAEPFCWYYGGAQTPEQEIIEQAQDVASGIMEILSLIERDDIAHACDEGRMLTPSRRGNLLRMAITTARMLSEECSSNIEYVNEKRRVK